MNTIFGFRLKIPFGRGQLFLCQGMMNIGLYFSVSPLSFPLPNKSHHSREEEVPFLVHLRYALVGTATPIYTFSYFLRARRNLTTIDH